MNENMKLWDAVKRPPATALKPIAAGRLKGKTDISPQWRMQVMTEQFGPCGEGWSYRIDQLWTEPGIEGQVFAFARVSVRIGNHESIPGIGGSMLIAKESSGLHHNDEAFKMAVTDALSVALKALGVAADIYLGLWDGSKYKTDPKEEPPKIDLDKLVKQVSVMIAKGDNYSAFETLELANLDNEKKLEIWGKFDSNERSIIKEYTDAQRKGEPKKD